MIRSSSRARTSERGFVLLAAIVLAVLYFALMELLLMDSARELREAQRFRARIVAAALAENGAELAARNVVSGTVQPVNEQDDVGITTGRLDFKAGKKFEIEGTGETKGAVAQRATVRVFGEVVGSAIRIDYTFHSQ